MQLTLRTLTSLLTRRDDAAIDPLEHKSQPTGVLSGCCLVEVAVPHNPIFEVAQPQVVRDETLVTICEREEVDVIQVLAVFGILLILTILPGGREAVNLLEYPLKYALQLVWGEAGEVLEKDFSAATLRPLHGVALSQVHNVMEPRCQHFANKSAICSL